jgi:hypothetical protein
MPRGLSKSGDIVPGAFTPVLGNSNPNRCYAVWPAIRKLSRNGLGVPEADFWPAWLSVFNFTITLYAGRMDPNWDTAAKSSLLVHAHVLRPPYRAALQLRYRRIFAAAPHVSIEHHRLVPLLLWS